jgi:CBS domain-containing protein
VPATEVSAWVAGFEYLQLLRLGVQAAGAARRRQPNRIEVASLNGIDRRVLRETLRVARRLQQRARAGLPALMGRPAAWWRA